MSEEDGPKMTIHAQLRWAERFSGLNMAFEWAQRRPARGKTRLKIRRQCPRNGKIYDANRQHYMLSEQSGVVWVVCSKTQEIITVFPYRKS